METNIPEFTQSLLHSHFSLKEFRRGQRPILESIHAGWDTLAVMPTGGGKSLCFQLPAFALKGIVVVVSPLISLMKDQVASLQRLGLPAGCLYSNQDREEKRQIFNQLREGGPYILYLSPERVQNPGFTEWVRSKNIVLFAIDEAHCISQWGPDFREDYHRLKLLRELRPDVPILGLTATATPAVLKDVSRQLKLKKPHRHVYGFYRPNLYYQVEICEGNDEKLGHLFAAVRKTDRGRVLIYCGTRRQTEELAFLLSEKFEGVSYYHAGLSTSTRKNVQERMAQNEIRILTATKAFGMGIDYPDVRLVVHFQMPSDIESYYQEVGRAGRDGASSHCLLLYSKRDRGLQSFFIRQSKADYSVIRRRWDSLEAITRFVEGGECRHAGILTYFQDHDRISECGHCDVCAPEQALRPTTVQPQQAITSSPKKKKKKVNMVLETEGSQERHDRLKEWRRNYAAKNNVPAFMVFSNKTLIDIANTNPNDKRDLYSIYGLGEAKIEEFGEEILAQL